MGEVVLTIISAILTVIVVLGLLYLAPIILPLCVLLGMICYGLAIIFGIFFIIVEFIKYLFDK